MLDFFKEVLILVRSFYRRVLVLLKSEDNVSSLQRYGLLSGNLNLSKAELSSLRLEIDKCLSRSDCNVWRDDLSSDERIYGIEQVSSVITNILDIKRFKKLGERYIGVPLDNYFVLGARISPRVGGVGSGGGWHRDSAFTHQFKVIIYLSDVTSSNGPFQYLEKSHRFFERIKFGSLRERRFPNLSDERLRRYKLNECLGKAGTTLFVDTKGIHRGKPIVDGSRYALTIYFFENNKYLNTFGKLLQRK